MTQIQRNHAARILFDEISRRYKDLDRGWLREQINAVVHEELRHVRNDIVNEIRRNAHYHGGSAPAPEDAVLTARKVLENIDRRMKGEQS
jgi:hypothetical protein